MGAPETLDLSGGGKIFKLGCECLGRASSGLAGGGSLPPTWRHRPLVLRSTTLRRCESHAGGRIRRRVPLRNAVSVMSLYQDGVYAILPVLGDAGRARGGGYAPGLASLWCGGVPATAGNPATSSEVSTSRTRSRPEGVIFSWRVGEFYTVLAARAPRRRRRPSVNAAATARECHLPTPTRRTPDGLFPGTGRVPVLVRVPVCRIVRPRSCVSDVRR